MKKQYIPPTLELFEFEVERGFALSPINNCVIIGDVSDDNEDVKEGNQYNIFDDDLWY